jgi:hypothetical protein
MPTPALADCAFYHTLDLPTFGRQEGLWNLTGRFAEYTGSVEVAGKTLLDIGTANGFLTWEAERRGASVTSFDIDRAEHLNELPFCGSRPAEDPEWLKRRGEQIEKTRNGYWLAHHDFGSNAECVYGNIYDLGPRIGTFDVVLVGQLLVHLPDAISALAAAASVCRETIVITEGNYPVDAPIAALCARADKPDIPYAWYHYSHGWYREVLAILGFASVTITVGSYICHQADHAAMIELATVVGQR